MVLGVWIRLLLDIGDCIQNIFLLLQQEKGQALSIEGVSDDFIKGGKTN